MPLDTDHLSALQAIVLKAPAGRLEEASAELFTRLLGLTFSVAKAGYQHGADMGSAGRNGRDLRIECKRYKESTPFGDRELEGEIAQAVRGTPGLEAWVLVATRDVPEQTENGLHQQAILHGVPVVIVDWKSTGTPALAALLASNPEITKKHFGTPAGDLARALQANLQPNIEALTQELCAWRIGYGSVRQASLERLQAIRADPRISNQILGQVVRTGPKVARKGLLEGLDNWWAQTAAGVPACVIGNDGVGKSWAVTDWLEEKEAELPITLVIPASGAPGPGQWSEPGLKQFLAEQLHALAQTRDTGHWRARVDRLLSRPASEGPAFLLVFDGLNQEPSVGWLAIMKTLQAVPFADLVRVILTTRPSHFESDLREFKALLVRPIRLNVNDFSDAELEQLLALRHLSRADLSPDLIPFARNPRLFSLVISVRERLTGVRDVTLHRLLLEYGRDTLGDRALSESEWNDWLKGIAEKARDSIPAFSKSALADVTQRADLSASDVKKRLSEIIDGVFARVADDGKIHLDPALIAHALGVGLIDHLRGAPDAMQRQVRLDRWLDPIAGLGERGEVLRAAVVIALETSMPVDWLGQLVTTWLLTQNLPEEHRRDLMALAPVLTSPLLDVLDQASPRTHASACRLALAALISLNRSDPARYKLIVGRATKWLSVVSRGVQRHAAADATDEPERQRAEWMITRIGRDESGPLTVFGFPLELVDRDEWQRGSWVPMLLTGVPLAEAAPVFAVAAAAAVVSRHSLRWEELKWLCLLNEIDPTETAAALRSIAADVALRSPEAGIHPELGQRIAAFLHWLTGLPEDEVRAGEFKNTLDRWLTYEQHYLADPAQSLFALERRHVFRVLADERLTPMRRAGRVGDVWFDPGFVPPVEFCRQLTEECEPFAVDTLYSNRYHSRDDHTFGDMQIPLARCNPSLLAEKERQWARSCAAAPSQARYWRAWRIRDALVLYGENEAAAARVLRQSSKDPKPADEAFASSNLLFVELQGAPALQFAKTVLDADLPYVWDNLSDAMPPLTSEEVDLLVEYAAKTGNDAERNLLALLTGHVNAISESAWNWATKASTSEHQHTSRLAFLFLASVDPIRFGRELWDIGWQWPLNDPTIAHAGSEALISATQGMPFSKVAERLAPWRILEAARRRGGNVVEVREAARLFDAVVGRHDTDDIDPGAVLKMKRCSDGSGPLGISIAPLPHPNPDSAEAAKLFFDDDARQFAYKEAREKAWERIKAAQKAGASLYTTDIAVADIQAVLDVDPSRVDRWVEGAADGDEAFVHRVRIAGGAFLSICEALLSVRPADGVVVWRQLMRHMSVRFIGRAGILDLLHMLFRAPDSDDVLVLRQEIYSLPNTRTDESLYELVLAASINDRRDWVESRIQEDAASPYAWRKRRAKVVAGFLARNELPVEGAWLDGPTETNSEYLQRKSARLRWLEACAHHWWREFWAAATPESSYAAWVLYRGCADRRAEVWQVAEARAADDGSPLFDLKRRHVIANRVKYAEGADKPSHHLRNKFLDRDIKDTVWPWYESD